MIRLGDETAGFSVHRTSAGVGVEAWGFWSVELALQFAPVVTGALDGIHGEVQVLVDVARLRPLRNEGQRAFESLLSWAAQGRGWPVLIRSPSALTKLQMLRLVRRLGPAAHIVVQ